VTIQTLVTLGVFAPLLGAMIAGFFGRRIGDVASQAVTTGLLFVSCIISWIVFSQWTWGGLEAFTVNLLPFVHVGDFQANWAIRVDAMSATMLIVVTSVSALVHTYSWGYMKEDDSRPRFFAYLSLFTFMMLSLVTAADFLQMFFGWEGVGLASYLLIGFWYKKPSATAASIKAFVVNRVGDFGFLLGMMTIFWMFGTIEFAKLFPLIADKAGTAWEFLGYNWSALELAGVLLFIGAMGKSAQFLLHTWLPDAMEGPTPVSALIHAATMVTAGVYMVCLLSPLYEHAPVASQFITIIGGITAIFAATVGMMQNDIKRVIAYSTCSQLGYMFFAIGVGAYQSAMFHLFTHAFFKALLFLGAGSVIHGMHHEQDMRKMGGLAKLLPITYATMMIGTIAITGMGIPGLWGFAGFYSKDSIIESAFASFQSGHSVFALFAFAIGLSAALLTAYYSWRLVFMTFHNKPQWTEEAKAAAHHDDHHHADAHAAHDDHHDDHGPLHPHESPWVMVLPLLILSVGAVFAGWAFAPHFVGHHEAGFWRGAIFTAEANHVLHDSHYVPLWVKWSPLIVTLIGTFVAFWLYVVKEGTPKQMAAKKGPLYTFLLNKWFWDELYEVTFVKATKALGDFFWKVGDVKIIDGLGPNGAAWASLKSGGWLSRFQSGFVYFYAFVMLIGVALFLAFAIFTWGA
jgi:NADH-quinone oxidoreductase subunit L